MEWPDAASPGRRADARGPGAAPHGGPHVPPRQPIGRMTESPSQTLEPERTAAPTVPLGEALGAWIKVALNSFGGPAGRIAVMHRVFADERGRISEQRFLHALNYWRTAPAGRVLRGPRSRRGRAGAGGRAHAPVAGAPPGSSSWGSRRGSRRSSRRPSSSAPVIISSPGASARERRPLYAQTHAQPVGAWSLRSHGKLLRRACSACAPPVELPRCTTFPAERSRGLHDRRSPAHPHRAAR